MAQFKRTLVTTALPYANGPVHLGHLAGVYLPADLYVRHKRLKGEEVLHIGGSDEHGVPITITAEKEGVTPADVVERYHRMNLEAFTRCGISFDCYGRTSSERHHETAQEFFVELERKGIFTRRTEKQFYDAASGRFLSDRYVVGTCPICGSPEASGDQCEQCGTHLSPTELIEPKSKLSMATPELRDTLHWYFPLGRFQEALEAFVSSHEDDWRPNVLNYTRTWLNAGLNDRAITRDLGWGIRVPLDEAEAAGKVLYVWFDAVLGYISFTREWAEREGDRELWRHWWQDPETRLVQFIGKDNVVFHTLMLPAILMGWNEGRSEGRYNLVDNVPASEFMNFEGRKFSKSRNYAVYLGEFLQKFPADTLRYSIAMNYPENKDSDFSWTDFQNRTNGELADTLGNFIKRSVDFTNSRFEGQVPHQCTIEEWEGIGVDWYALQSQLDSAYEGFHFREAATISMDVARAANRFLTAAEPWKAIKSDPDAAARTMALSLNLCHALSILFYPVIPETCDRIHRMLGFKGGVDGLVRKGEPILGTLLEPALSKGHPLSGESEILFTKIEDKEIEPELRKIEALVREAEAREAGATEQKMQFKPTIEFDDFQKVDLRAATVTAAEKVKKASKLLKLQVQVGSSTRQVLAGVAEHYAPEEMVGRNVLLVANLAPRTIRGEVSEGMLLAVEGEGGRLYMVEPQGEKINGQSVQ
ncbi:methionine--tRNA ligase [Chlorobium sp. N1]|uniref:methionine--tRNA ligase n=1 Tax=Chlorobium sp. N1 TaxID=2491138 RepID=UPI0010402352|nr:methionine--tRNA ligase [Chlorobium sp. N1]TCD47177.1 methionine--tRNA ligase [Chlorobium sp. N1]